MSRLRAAPVCALDRLDQVLGRALAAARLRYGTGDDDGFRGMYVSEEQAARAVDGQSGKPLLGAGDARIAPGWDAICRGHAGWSWVRDAHGLSDAELDVLLFAVAPEIDLRYERLYSYLQDDVTRRRPTVDLALDLLSRSAAEKLAARALLRADAPLLAAHLVRLVPDQRSPDPPMLAHAVVPDEQVVDALLLQGGLDRRLVAVAELTVPPAGEWDGIALSGGERAALLTAARAAWEGTDLHLHFHGPAGSGRRAAAAALAGELGVPLLTVDLARLYAASPDADGLVFRAFREAGLQGALLHAYGIDAVPDRGPARRSFAERLRGLGGLSVTSGSVAWTPVEGTPLGVVDVSLRRPNVAVRRRLWERGLAAAEVVAEPDVVEDLAARFQLGPGPVDGAVAHAVAAARARPCADPSSGPSRADLFAGARLQTRHRLAALARVLEPVARWTDLVLPEDAARQLRELCARVALRQRVQEKWGLGGASARGRGVAALFTGPPGTGKTMAAEVVAAELGLDLVTVDLPSVISKYVGETEKNLERIFAGADDADAVLLFDEADALFGKRSEVRDSHDRYANIETSYLLQRMERYDGIAILATNLRGHLDEAFTRRLQFVIDFPFPDEGRRRRIWELSLPARLPRAADVDLDRLAAEFRLSGADIGNAALHAAYRAAAHDRPLAMADLLAAVRREHQKAGRVVTAPPEEG